MDLSSNIKLETFPTGDTSLIGVTLAGGAPLIVCVLPATLQALEPQYLSELTNAGLQLEGTADITRLVIDNCSLIDWNTLLQQCSATNYLRITGTSMDEDGSLLHGLTTIGGASGDGGDVQTCRLVGMYRLTQPMSDRECVATCAHSPELNIIQLQFVCIKVGQTVEDGEKIINLDNPIGYDYNTELTPPSHILEMSAKRHCVLAKKTTEGEMTYYPFHDESRNKYVDSGSMENATDTVLTGSGGEVYVYKPHYQYKGATDVLNQCLYGSISSNEDAPAVTGYISMELIREELEVAEGTGVHKNTDYTTLEEAKNECESGPFVLADVWDYKRVRFPGLASTLYRVVLTSDTGKIVSRISVSDVDGFINGMYLFCVVPAGATKLAFTFLSSATFDFVLFTTSESVETIEPDWVEHMECLGGAYETYSIDDALRSASDVSSVETISQAQAIKYAQNWGKDFQLFDWEIHRDAGNLHLFKYGNTDSQEACGYGTSNYQKVTGLTNALGTCGTVSYYKGKGGSNPQAEGAYRDGINYQPVNVLGHEDLQGNKAEQLQHVTVNETAADGRRFITMSDRTERVAQGITVYNADIYPTYMAWGRHMDLIIAKEGGSTFSHWLDRFCVGTEFSHVIYRSHNYASVLGDVSCAGASHGSSVAGTYIGVRFALRGIMRWVGSVAAFKAINQAD